MSKANIFCPCGRKISRRENRLNAGLCNRCYRDELSKIARKLGRPDQ